MTRSLPRLLFIFGMLSAYGAAAAPAQPTPTPNTLSAAEKRQGWRLLFDGKTLAGWRGFHQTDVPNVGWKVQDDSIVYEPVCPTCEKPGDLITKDEYDNFELRIDWKLSPKGNSGVKYLVDESLVKTGHGGLGFEMQVLDNEGHPDAKKGIAGNRTAGGLYDLIPPAQQTAKPVGQWNEARLVVHGNHIEHWLNGQKVVEYERGCQMMKALIAGSKYAANPGFGEAAKGHLLLQDHGDQVWFRNIKLRVLPAPKTKTQTPVAPTK
ncbi:MAG: DUF1080 domain-containing protein [Deltaproteobacteria bacterium]|nr:DUF1080 domain-containing protein [Deltaproteobacteria bacterium]